MSSGDFMRPFAAPFAGFATGFEAGVVWAPPSSTARAFGVFGVFADFAGATDLTALLAFTLLAAAWAAFGVRVALAGAAEVPAVWAGVGDAVLRRAGRADPEDVTMGFLGEAWVC
ncbi:hypothetical protein [Paraburkholderia sp.]|uniref:hypothetical protein n=1 Tax=Paraburkholderia sp. TaxID=1926495 RepID=UPI00257B522F|nr:hypothetical protein [Paraburkholderia sp.]